MALAVTGAMGHLGFEIVRQAASQGADVIALYRSGYRAADAQSITGRVVWVQADLNDQDQVRALAKSRAITSCIHCAAVSNEAQARPNPLEAIASNISATANLLDMARLQGWQRFVLVSTGSVFQNRADTVSPILEDARPEPGNIYSTTKLSAEMLTRMYRTEFGLPAASVRISWVFGPPVVSNSPARGPIPSYLLRACRGEAIRESGAGFAASFTFVSDAAAGLLAAAMAPELRFDTYHLGHGVNFTAEQVAQCIRARFPQCRIELAEGTAPWTDFTALRGPLAGARLAQDTGFKPAFTLDQGVGAYAEWMLAHPGLWQQRG